MGQKDAWGGCVLSLDSLLERNKEAIVRGWVKEVLAAYPADGAALFANQQDPFANPVGASVREGTRGVFEALLTDMDAQRIRGHLDEMVKIRAVQQFSPSQALSFVFALKSVIRDVVPEVSRDPRYRSELTELETRIDRVALAAFDLFMEAREEVSQLRISEVKRQVTWIMDKMNQRNPARDPVPPDAEPQGSDSQFELKEDLR
jgi:hypothetical protein